MSYTSLNFDRNSRVTQSSARILLCGKSFIADISGAVFWPAEQTLIISDPHLKSDEKTHYPSISLHNHETRSTLIRALDVAQHYDAKRIIMLGCSATGCSPEDPLDEENMERLSELQKYYLCYWVMNEQAPDYLKAHNAMVSDHFKLNQITFRHQPTRAPISHEIAGGMNPVAKLKTDHKTNGQKCFLSNSSRLILPTFASTGPGKNVLGKDFDPMFNAGSLYACIIGTNDVHPVAPRLLEEE